MTDISEITAEQKAQILADAAAAWSTTIRDIDHLPDNGPLAVVFLNGFNTAVGLMIAEFGANVGVVISGSGSLKDDFSAQFSHIVGHLTPDHLSALKERIPTVEADAGDTSSSTSATSTTSATDPVSSATVISGGSATSGTEAASLGTIISGATMTSNTSTTELPNTSMLTSGETTTTSVVTPKPATGGEAVSSGSTQTAINPTTSPTA